MKKYLKKAVFSLIGRRNVVFAKIFFRSVYNYYHDFKLFYGHSTVFKQNNYNKLEALMIIDYHRLEKGMLFEEMKPRFGKESVERLHSLLGNNAILSEFNSRSQVVIAFKVMIKYFQLHKSRNIDIEDYYTLTQYNSYLQKISTLDGFQGAHELDRDTVYKSNELPFDIFARSRKSIRSFNGEKIDLEIIRSAIALALTAPSVCNRKASKVHLVEDKAKIDRILKIQGGFNGYIENVNQLLILTNDRNFYYTVGERNQLFIDGGIFLMNLLYS